jgi:hypothetical protein
MADMVRGGAFDDAGYKVYDALEAILTGAIESFRRTLDLIEEDALPRISKASRR